jgi:hypothetical protein
MHRTLPVTLAVSGLAVALLSADVKFTSAWRSSEAGTVSFAGKKVAALVISADDSLRIPGEEALARELSTRGMQSVATYKIAPKEELQSAERAKPWFERANIEGVVALRPVRKDSRTSYNVGMWMDPYYSSFWGYYGYGWGTTVVFGAADRDTIVMVETTIYSIPQNRLLWAAVSESKNPGALQSVVQDIVKESVKELHKQGLAKSIAK